VFVCISASDNVHDSKFSMLYQRHS